MAKVTVEQKDENPKIEARVTRLEALVRIMQKKLSEHFGMETEGNTRIGLMFITLIATVGLAVAVDTVVDWGTGVSGTIGTAKITTDGTNATLTVDRLTTGATNVVSSTGMTVSGVLTVSGAQTNTSTLKVTGTTTLNSLTVTNTATLTNLVINSALIKISGLPTTTNGLTSGYLWASNNVISIIP